MEAIKDTIVSIMQDLRAKKINPSSDPHALIRKALTKKESRHIKFNYFKKGILSLYVDSSGWLYNLSLKKEELLAKFNKSSGAIKDIRFRIGEIK